MLSKHVEMVSIVYAFNSLMIGTVTENSRIVMFAVTWLLIVNVLWFAEGSVFADGNHC